MIYLDHNATAPVLPEVRQAMLPLLTESFGNPSSAHSVGRKARQALEDAREQVAALLGAFPDEVIFTSGATEANNLALFGLAGEEPAHILASPIEHPCVIEPLKQLAAKGFEVEWLPVAETGSLSEGRIICQSRELGATFCRCDIAVFTTASRLNWVRAGISGVAQKSISW